MTRHPLNILKVNSSSRRESSVSRRLTERLASRLATDNPDSVVVSRDVDEGLPIISEDWINANYTPVDQRSTHQRALLELSNELVTELRTADVLLIGTPIYNFGVPAALKVWIDLVCRAGETFSYSDTGPVGLLTGKRAIISVTSGGVPVGSDMDHATKYLKQVLEFIGITDVSFVSATGLAYGDPDPIIQATEAEIDAMDMKLAA